MFLKVHAPLGASWLCARRKRKISLGLIIGYTGGGVGGARVSKPRVCSYVRVGLGVRRVAFVSPAP